MWISSLLVAIPLRVSEWGSEIYFGQFVFGIALLVYIINRIHWCAALHYAAFVDSGRDSRRKSAIDLLLTVAMLMTHDRAHVSPAVINAKTRCLSRITIFFIHHLHLTSPLILIVLSSLDTGIQSTMEMLPFKRGCCNCSPCPPPIWRIASWHVICIWASILDLVCVTCESGLMLFKFTLMYLCSRFTV